LLVAPDTPAITGMIRTMRIIIIRTVIMALRMDIKATVIVVDGNTINGQADIKRRK
jgi:hypothetical protein